MAYGRLCERFKVVPVFESNDLSSATTGDSINMKHYHRVMFLILSTTTDWTAGPDVTVYEGATAAAETNAMTFYYRYGGAAAGSNSADILAAWASGSTAAIDNDHEGYLYIIEVAAEDMDQSNNYDWLTIKLNDDASAGECVCVAILEPRYAQNDIPTALE